jgi:hypothetical protein
MSFLLYYGIFQTSLPAMAGIFLHTNAGEGEHFLKNTLMQTGINLVAN